MQDSQPSEVTKPEARPVSSLLTQVAERMRSEGAVDWKCEHCQSAGLIPYGAQVVMIRKAHQKVADNKNSGEDYEQGPPWLPCGITVPVCPHCRDAQSSAEVSNLN